MLGRCNNSKCILVHKNNTSYVLSVHMGIIYSTPDHVISFKPGYQSIEANIHLYSTWPAKLPDTIILAHALSVIQKLAQSTMIKRRCITGNNNS